MAQVIFLAHYRVLQEKRRMRILRMERRRLRDNLNPFELPIGTFVSIFRLNKEAAQAYIDEILPYMRQGERISGIPVEIKIFCALNFFASGSYQKVIGQTFVTNMSQAMVSSIIKEVTSASIRVVNRWVWFPRNNDEKNIIKARFYQKFNLPNIIGAVDGTHVAITKPPTANDNRPRDNAPRRRLYREEDYVNRKGYHSLNVQIICDSKMRILSMNASFPGRSHDSFIWTNSRVSELIRANFQNGDESYILGDSGYPSLPWLFIPVSNPAPNSAEDRFNWAHVRARCTVERCIGVLKGRFRCLLKDRTLHYEPDRACRIILTCGMLHNIALHYNSRVDRLRYDEIDIEDRVQQQRPAGAGGVQRLEGQRERQRYINNNFN